MYIRFQLKAVLENDIKKKVGTFINVNMHALHTV